MYFTKERFSPNPADSNYDQHAVIQGHRSLIAYGPRPKVVVKKNLISGDVDDAAPPSSVRPWWRRRRRWRWLMQTAMDR